MTDRIDPKAIADGLRAGCGNGCKTASSVMLRAADTIDKLAEQLKTADRQFTALKVSSGKSDARAVELAAVVEKVRGVIGAEIGWESPAILIGRIQWALSTAPADALAEHDAALIESLADDRGVDASEDHDDDEWWVGYRQAQREIIHWLTKRARQLREGEA